MYRAFTIFSNGIRVGVEFGIDAAHAIRRYAKDSIYPVETLTAKQGIKG